MRIDLTPDEYALVLRLIVEKIDAEYPHLSALFSLEKRLREYASAPVASGANHRRNTKELRHNKRFLTPDR